MSHGSKIWWWFWFWFFLMTLLVERLTDGWTEIPTYTDANMQILRFFSKSLLCCTLPMICAKLWTFMRSWRRPFNALDGFWILTVFGVSRFCSRFVLYFFSGSCIWETCVWLAFTKDFLMLEVNLWNLRAVKYLSLRQLEIVQNLTAFVLYWPSI